MTSLAETVSVAPANTQDPGAAPPLEQTSNTQLVRQPSVYSLTLDEFQNTVCEPGKSFGSMNMDEFIANIWTAEESQAVAAAMEAVQSNPGDGETVPIVHQPSLSRQGSLTIPPPLCRKTVEEVWNEIHRGKSQQQQVSSTHGNANNNHPNGENCGNAARQPTFGEMTLEDFLIKAGVVREGCAASSSSSQHQQQQQQQQYGYFRNHNGVEPDYPMAGNVMGYGYADNRNTADSANNGVVPPYQGYPQQQQQQQQGGVMGEGLSNFGGNGNRNGGFPCGCFGGRMGNGGGMAGSLGIACGSPVSSVPSDGMCGGVSQGLDNSVSQYGLEMTVGGSGVIRGGGGRKRGTDGEPLEKGVERRQRRMIKNRESAARSRARKQAYTVELEAELEMLKEENARLRKEQEEEEAKRKEKLLEAIAKAASAIVIKQKTLRRTATGPW